MQTTMIDKTQVFAAFVEQHREHLYKYIYRRMRCADRAEQAEDVTQTALLRAWKQFREKPIPESTDTQRMMLQWLFTIGSNVLIDEWRYRSHRIACSLEAEVHTTSAAYAGEALTYAVTLPSNEDIEEDYARRETIMECLAQLRPDYRVAMILFAYYRYPIPTIAQHLGKSIDATKMLVSRGRKEIKAYTAKEIQR